MAEEAERKMIYSRSKNRGISVTSKEARDKESVRSASKIKILRPSSSKLSARGPSTKPERHMRTVASVQSDSMQLDRRSERL